LDEEKQREKSWHRVQIILKDPKIYEMALEYFRPRTSGAPEPSEQSKPDTELNPYFSRSTAILWPFVGSAVGIFVMPLLAIQYPNWFNDNIWLLPISIGIVVLCWVLPFLLHPRTWSLFRWTLTLKWWGKLLALTVTVCIAAGLYLGCARIIRFHLDHMTTLLGAKSTPKPDVVKEMVIGWLQEENHEVLRNKQLDLEKNSAEQVFWSILVIDPVGRKLYVTQFKDSPDRLDLVALLKGDPDFNNLPKRQGDAAVGEMRRELVRLNVGYAGLDFPIAGDFMITKKCPITPGMSKFDFINGLNSLSGAIIEIKEITSNALHS
jgi:hypothetical protein